MADYSRQRAEREFNRNPPANAPGQGQSGASGWDNMELDPSNGSNMNSVFSGNTDSTNLQDFLNGCNTNIPGQQPVQTMSQPMGQPQGMPGQQPVYQQQQGEDLFDKTLKGIFVCLVAFIKAVISFFKVFFPALANNNYRDWHRLGTCMCKISLGEGVVWLILAIIHMVTKSLHNLSPMIISIGLSCLVGFVLVAYMKTKMVKARQKKPEIKEDISTTPVNEPEETSDIWDFSEGSSDEGDSDGDSVWNWGDDDSESSDWFGDEDESSANSDNFDPVQEASKIDIPAGQYTRSYLLETFLKVLPSINPNFHKMNPVYEDSDEFMQFDGYLRDSAIQTGVTGDKLEEIYLESVEENPFVVRLMVTRPAGIKEQEIADGVADCYKRDEHGAVIEDREGCYASVDVQVGRFAINIFKCANVMVSLGDVLRYKKDWVLNPKIIMPLFWGVNEMGKVYCYDGIKAGNGSMLISGEGRSGKSWKGQSLIAQMSMFMSPNEVHFYFFDNKGKLSDYYYLSTKVPHVKGFCGDPLKYVSELHKILDREKPIREKAIHSAGVNNINDYNKLNPTNKLPYIYIVVDEMAAAMKEMDAYDKELHKQFNSLMLSIITNLPYFGIRLLLFPHRLVDFIIDKTTAQQISCRSVMGVLDFETLKSALDIRNKKDFPYNLVKPGDMAIRTKDIRNGVATFTKSEVLSDSETTNRKIFDYIGAVWGKLEPDCKPCIRYDDGKSSGKPARDVSSTVGDYSVRNAFSDPKDTIFTDEENGATIDELLGEDDSDEFWGNWKG